MIMRQRFVPWSGCVSQWANWLSRQYGELEIWVRIPAKAQIFLSQLSFKVCSDAKKRVGCGKQRKATASIQSLVKLQPRFLRLQWKTFLWTELQSWLVSLQWKICLWAELQPWFLSLKWKTCLWTELQPCFLLLQWNTCCWAELSDDDDATVKYSTVYCNQILPSQRPHALSFCHVLLDFLLFSLPGDFFGILVVCISYTWPFIYILSPGPGISSTIRHNWGINCSMLTSTAENSETCTFRM